LITELTMDSNFQLMDDYLQGNLDKEGLKVFTEKLKQEPSFELEFREMRAIQLSAKASARLSTIANLKRLESSIEEKETTKINYNMKKLVTVAASILLLATVSYFTVFNKADIITGPNIYSEYYQTYQNVESTTQRGGALALTTLKNKAYFAYDSRDFVQAASLFSELLKADKTAANYLYAGLSNLEIGDHESATRSLNTVTNNYEDLVAQSKWFLAMNLLKQNSEASGEEALSSLVSLTLGNSSYKVKAEEILAKMGITTRIDSGEITEYKEIPDEGDVPDGSEMDSRGKRRVQFGTISGHNGRTYRFFTDDPIEGLEVGDVVDFMVLKKQKGKRRMGFAFIL